MLISVNPAFGFRNLDLGLLTCFDVRPDGRRIEKSPHSQGPPERFEPHGEIETFGCRVQPRSTPGQPEPQIDNDPGLVLTSVIALRDNSQQCGPNIATTAAHTRSRHAMGLPLTDPSQPIDLHQSTA